MIQMLKHYGIFIDILVWLWNMLMVEISSKKFLIIKREINSLLKNIYGISFYKCLKDLRLFINSRFYTGISRYKSIKLIQSANVFLTKSGIAKVGDMNVSKVLRK